MSGRVIEADEAAYIQEHHVFLHFDERLGASLWSPHRKVPKPIQRAIFAHREELAAMLRAGDSRTCPAADLHKSYWKQSGVCAKCIELDTAIQAAGQELAS